MLNINENEQKQINGGMIKAFTNEKIKEALKKLSEYIAKGEFDKFIAK